MFLEYKGIQYEPNDAYSDKDMTGWDLSDRTNMSGTVIHGLCLSNETPDAQVLPPDLTGTTFLLCNLCNVLIPPGNQVIDCQTTRFEVQNDLRDWKLDEDDSPVEPVNVKGDLMQGYSIDPASIPDDFIRRETVLKADYARDVDTPEFKSWFLESPLITDTQVKELRLLYAIEDWKNMISEGNYYPFDSGPEAEMHTEEGQVWLTGEQTYITIEGKGLIKGGVGFRPFDNRPEDYKG
jgi:hypothetical protein